MAKIHSKVIFPVELAEVGGDLFELAYKAFLHGNERTYSNGILTLNGLDPLAQPTFAELAAVVNNGGYFEGIRLAIKFANAAAAQQLVPIEVRGATYNDEEGVLQNRTWVEWFRVNTNTQVITDGTQFVSKSVFNGELLNSTELIPIYQQSGIEVIEWEEAVGYYQDENWITFEL